MWDYWIILIAFAIVSLVASGLLAFYKPGMGFIAGMVLSVVMVVSGAVSGLIEIFAAAPCIFLLR
jgi:phage-related protein